MIACTSSRAPGHRRCQWRGHQVRVQAMTTVRGSTEWFPCAAQRAGEPRRWLVRRRRGCSGANGPFNSVGLRSMNEDGSFEGTVRAGTPLPSDAGASEVPPLAALRRGTGVLPFESSDAGSDEP